jgi:SAM-dependent methyltransferase
MANNTTLDRLEYYRDQYAARVMDWTPATARYERRAAALLSSKARVLDLGCGRGGISERLHTRGRWFGIDPDGASVREHRVVALARAQAGAGRLPFPAASFDLVVSSWVLEHLPNPDGVFQEVSRVLKPGGRFLALTPNARHPIPRVSRLLMRMVRLQQQIVAWGYGRAPADTFPVHYAANTPEALGRAATSAGLCLVAITLVEDPAYFAWDRWSFRFLAIPIGQGLPPLWKVHLIAEYVKAANNKTTNGHIQIR